MNQYYWLRNGRASDLLELFFVSAVGSVLATRLYLDITGYPSLGGKTFHIAHMLPGGLLMLVGLVIIFSFIGYRAKRASAVIAGIGFGLFIDELGKFITRDNNYFFQPTIALIYLMFVILFLTFRQLTKVQALSPTENLLNAISLMEEAVIHDLDSAERARVLHYLHQSDKTNPLVQPLIGVFEELKPNRDYKPHFSKALRQKIEARYRQFVSTVAGVRAVDALFVVMALWSIGVVLAYIPATLSDLELGVANISPLDVLQGISTLAATWYVARGIGQMRGSREQAYEFFMRSVLINIFATQFFEFYREQFAALPLFIFYALLYVLLRLGIAEERRMHNISPS